MVAKDMRMPAPQKFLTAADNTYPEETQHVSCVEAILYYMLAEFRAQIQMYAQLICDWRKLASYSVFANDVARILTSQM